MMPFKHTADVNETYMIHPAALKRTFTFRKQLREASGPFGTCYVHTAHSCIHAVQCSSAVELARAKAG